MILHTIKIHLFGRIIFHFKKTNQTALVNSGNELPAF